MKRTIVLKPGQITKSGLAALLGVSTRSVDFWVQKHKYFAPAKPSCRGKFTLFNLADVKAAVLEHSIPISDKGRKVLFGGEPLAA